MRFEHRIGIRASADDIWAVLSDLEAWADWNPLYPRADGVIRIGEVLDLDLALPGLPVQAIQPRVLDWAPYDHIHWRHTTARGWIQSIRFLEIEELGPTNCIFSNGEIFSGLATGLVVRPQRRAIRAGFESLGEALKVRVEQGAGQGAAAPGAAAG